MTGEGPVVPGFWAFAKRHPDHHAVIDAGGMRLSYGEMGARVNRLSNALLRLGFRNRDRLAMVLSNTFDHLEIAMAATQVGVDQVPINVHLTAPEVEYLLRDSKPRAVIVEESTLAVARAAGADLGLDILQVERGVQNSIYDHAEKEADSSPPQRVGGSTMAYTSGTSGRPKGVRRDRSDVLPEDGVVPSLAYLLSRFGVDLGHEVGNGTYLSLCPLYHGAPGGYARLALHLGQTVVLPGRFHAEETLRLIDEHKVTWLNAVPTMFKRLLDLPPEVKAHYDVSSLTRVVHAAAPCPPEIKRRMLQWWGPIIYEFYASTEAGGTCIGPEEWVEHAPSVGRPWSGADIRIIDEDGEDKPPGEVGKVYFLNTRPFEYHNDPEKTAAAKSPDGRYVTTGDLGYLDEAGYLFLLSRRSDLIISGGVNIYPAEVEAVLLEHPAVADAAVLGADDKEWGRVPVAVIEPKAWPADEPAFIEDLIRHCRSQLAAFKRPVRYILDQDVGRNASGKIRRDLLARRHQLEDGTDLEPRPTAVK